jgi:enolase-phosphatase E1
MPRAADVQGVLLDIEGTTTPIAFVHDVLFPYARERLDDAIARASAEPAIAEALARLWVEWGAEARGTADLPPFGSGAPYARWLIDHDRKSTGLKALQGLIWAGGYRDGSLRAPVYPDVPEALRRWRARAVPVRIFSSGSVLAQQLLFAHTDRGDLTGLIDGWHDMTTGAKRDPESYRRIAAAFPLPAPNVLFLSDVTDELDAAAAAGMQAALCARPGNAAVARPAHPVVQSLLELVG